MSKRENDIKKLELVATNLKNGWVVNKLLSEKLNNIFLMNREGLYIRLSYVYPKKLVQWSICVNNSRYRDYYQSLYTLGCDLNKDVKSIVNDINRRLLTPENTTNAYKEIEKIATENGSKINILESRKHVISSLKKVLKIENSHHHSYDSYHVMEDDHILADLEHKNGFIDAFSLNLRGVKAEDVIKIMTLLNEKEG